MTTARPKTAFTLTELLIVVAVLTMLVSMVLPALAKSKVDGNAAQCLNNLKQIGLASALYFSDEAKVVRVACWPEIWLRRLQHHDPAVGAAGICPGAPARTASQLEQDSSPAGWVNRAWLAAYDGTNSLQGSYALNGFFYSNDPFGVVRNRNYASNRDIKDPARTPLFADAIWLDAWPQESDRPATNLFNGDQFQEGGLSRIAIPRHGATLSAAVKNFNPRDTLPGAVNVAFADNHAETVPLENLWNLYWHNQWQPLARRPGK